MSARKACVCQHKAGRRSGSTACVCVYLHACPPAAHHHHYQTTTASSPISSQDLDQILSALTGPATGYAATAAAGAAGATADNGNGSANGSGNGNGVVAAGSSLRSLVLRRPGWTLERLRSLAPLRGLTRLEVRLVWGRGEMGGEGGEVRAGGW